MDTAILSRGLGGQKQDVDKLRKVLSDNGFKHTQSAAKVMLDEMRDLGLDNEVALYFEAVSINL